jgi:hypothetical protein
MNWGKATVAILVAFVLFIGGLSYFMASAPNDEYDHQYYEDGLNFDHDYNREKQVVKDNAQPVIVVDTCCIKLTFPQQIMGEVKMSRPSSDASDTSFTLDNKNGLPIQILTKHLVKGKWQLVIDWKSNNKAYLYQQEVEVK